MTPPISGSGPLTLEALAAVSAAHFKQCEEREARHAKDAEALQRGMTMLGEKIDSLAKEQREAVTALARERREEGRRLHERIDAAVSIGKTELEKGLAAEAAAREAGRAEQRDDKRHESGIRIGWIVLAITIGAGVVQAVILLLAQKAFG